jgi:hypothetical protein
VSRRAVLELDQGELHLLLEALVGAGPEAAALKLKLRAELAALARVDASERALAKEGQHGA